jgi:beta-lactamase regulating signal transducer with metallopeptidase domain
MIVWCREFILARVEGPGNAVMAAVGTLVGIIAAGRAVVFVARECFDGYRLRRHVNALRMPPSSRIARSALSAGAATDDIAFFEDRTPAAFTYGLFRPIIAVSSGLARGLTLAELRAVIAHERRHQVRLDPLRNFLWALCVRTLFFLPLLADIAAACALRREVVADRCARAGAGGRALASAMLKSVRGTAPAFSSVAAFGHLQARIKALAAPGSAVAFEFAAPKVITTALVAAIIVLASAVSTPQARARDGTALAQCEGPEVTRMSRINFSPYVRIEVGPMMSAAVQSAETRP